MKEKITSFLIILYVIYLMSPILVPLTSAFAAWMVLIVFAWKSSHFLVKNYLMRRLRDTHGLGKAVIITGCGGGFGIEFALQLNKLGFFVFAGCRRPDEDGALELKRVSIDKNLIQVFKLDVTSDGDVQKCHELVIKVLEEKKLKLHAIVNNAGVAYDSAVEFHPAPSVDDYQRVLDVNCLGTIRMCRMFLPLLRTTKGRIINVTSLAASIPMMIMSHYCISKLATASFSEMLQHEVQDFGVKVVDIQPAYYKTPMVDKDKLSEHIRKGWSSTSDEVRRAYGQSRFNLWTKLIQVLTSHPMTVQDSLEDILEAFLDSVTSPSPEQVYRVMTWEKKIFYFFYTLCPIEIRTFFMDRYLMAASTLNPVENKK